MASPPLPALPAIRLSVLRDRTAESRITGGFLNLSRLDVVAFYPDGSRSAPFAYDIARRAALDAIVIAAHFERHGVRHVYLRSAVRPPCALREIPPDHDGCLWELPAGLIEVGEAPEEAAARELGEELGFAATADAMTPLGPWAFPCPGVIGERHLFYSIEVDPRARKAPTEDGSAIERGAAIITVSLADALAHCRSGVIRDSKTELALRRLLEAP
ncbi:MAG: NUDIX domain-containing protein [Polyangiaceae bacterium]